MFSLLRLNCVYQIHLTILILYFR